MKRIALLVLWMLPLASWALTIKQSRPQSGDNDVPISGYVVIMFDAPIKMGSGQATLNGETLEATFVSTVAKFQYAGLDYSSDYCFTLPAGLVTDQSGKAFEGIEISFRTMNRPEVAAKTFDFVVDPAAQPNGSSIGNTIQSAVNAMPDNSTRRYYVFIKNGVYKEKIVLSDKKKNISLIGENRDSVIIAHTANPAVEIYGDNVYVENLCFKATNDPDFNQYNMAIHASGHKNIYKNVLFLGHQDTQQTSGDRHYFKDCEIRGTIDFVYGSGNVFYDSCRLYLEPRNRMMLNAAQQVPGTVAWDTACVIVAGAQSTDQIWGHVFSHCIIDGDPSNDGRYSLGRPWHNDCRAVYLHTTMLIKPFDFGWTSMGNPPTLYAEYGSVDAEGRPIDLSKRHNRYLYEGTTYTCEFNPVLTTEEASQYTLRNVLSGKDAWLPDRICEAPEAVTPVVDGGTITWEKQAYSMCYIVRYNGRVCDIVTGNSYVPSKYGHYSIQAVGEYGFTGAQASIDFLNPSALATSRGEVVRSRCYNLMGQPIERPETGCYIEEIFYDNGECLRRKCMQ